MQLAGCNNLCDLPLEARKEGPNLSPPNLCEHFFVVWRSSSFRALKGFCTPLEKVGMDTKTDGLNRDKMYFLSNLFIFSVHVLLYIFWGVMIVGI